MTTFGPLDPDEHRELAKRVETLMECNERQAETIGRLQNLLEDEARVHGIRNNGNGKHGYTFFLNDGLWEGVDERDNAPN